ncbi:arsenate reductase (glutaredoxin) [Spongiibacter nanhainus]|uniref:Arsenate reductase n=1 Tax=Spongiibacter nanhainus TaxID=2794344 RepID=A0A7T4R3R9_9GAMM|nr:arsenate reductase (glutaredoxin) [Spongiibacter nanhainus]QQD19755.1 arsenate reductase (glutaredoxin) [Spongiibacter nanhainus]
MSDYTIYHNPRCSKSRQTLQLLEENGIEAEVIRYLETPPDAATLAELLEKLGLEPRQLLRKGEAEYKELGLADSSLSDDDLIKAMVAAPKLIERPIVVKGARAVLGRPPENVLELIAS